VPPELVRSAAVAALGSFLFGFDTAVISGATDALRQHFSLGSQGLGLTVASALVGTIVGSLAVSAPLERHGRRPVLLVLAVLYVISALGCGLALNWPSLVAFRLLGGVAIGGSSVAAPMYIAEISPAALRGRLVALSQLNIVIGILVAYLSNSIVELVLGGLETAAWRMMLGLPAVPAAIFYVLALAIPESPRWLLAHGRGAEAEAVLTRVGAASPRAEATEIAASLASEATAAGEPFLTRKYRTPILLALMIATFNQVSGINALIYYTADIFAMAGAGRASALWQSVIIGVTNLVFTLLAMTVIDRVGRRRLLLVGSVGLAACLFAAAWAFERKVGSVLLVSLIGYIACFAFSQGAVIWVYLAEIFPNRVRARGQALGSFTHWFWAAAVSWSFPIVAEATGGLAFAVFGVMMVLQFVLVLLFLPETKGVSLEEIQKRLGIA
jgi:MFS transporter, SP family, xylose:H+ symportor